MSRAHGFLFLLRASWTGLLLALLAAAQQQQQREQAAPRPVLHFAQAVVVLEGNTTEVSLAVELEGAVQLPVAAGLRVVLPGNASAAALEQAQRLLEPNATVSWAAGDSGARSVRLRWPAGSLSGVEGADELEVALVDAHGADVDPRRSATTVALQSVGAPPLFGFEPNLVAYPPGGSSGPTGAAAVPVALLAGPLSEVATLQYELVAPNGAGRRALPAAAAAGFLYFRPGGPDRQLVPVPLDWAAVPPEAEYRLGLRLRGFYNARARAQHDDVALHVFGVAPGACPPGTARRNTTQPPPSAAEPGQVETRAGGGVRDLALSLNGTVIDLSSRFAPAVREYGAQVEADVDAVVLCLRRTQADGNVSVSAGGGAPEVGPLQDPVEDFCDCEASRAGAAGEGCDYQGWLLPLEPGQNTFSVTLEGAATAGSGAAGLTYSLAVVRLAEPAHVELASLELKAGDGTLATLCGTAGAGARRAAAPAATPPANPAPQARQRQQLAGAGDLDAPAWLPISKEGTVSLPAAVAAGRCVPDVAMAVGVPSGVGLLRLVPSLAFPGVEGVRVEVNGKVLSRGGDVAADQLEDTTSRTRARPNAEFLPAAFIMGMQPGVPMQIEVVVVAEDGVTSARYAVDVTRLPPAPVAVKQQAVAYEAAATAEQQQRSGWPASPAQQPECMACPAGWASGSTDAAHCAMCPPGMFSSEAQSLSCTACPAGSYALSWGSTHCKHCILGTYAAAPQSVLCTMCPPNTTNYEDGMSACDVPVSAGADPTRRHAVVVSFTVYLSGVDPDSVVLKAGVNAPVEEVVGSLLRSDTAHAFNISISDVHVQSISQVTRRTLLANVTATLGVNLPANATEEEIAAALEVQKLSADKPIELLSHDPDRFFGRTTQTLDIVVTSGNAATFESRPEAHGGGPSRWALLAPAVGAAAAGLLLVGVGCRRSRRLLRARQLLAARLPNSAAARYLRFG